MQIEEVPLSDILPGTELTIYEDPWTRTRPEGRAVVQSVVREGKEAGVGWADCWVRFVGDDDDCFRTITTHI